MRYGASHLLQRVLRLKYIHDKPSPAAAATATALTTTSRSVFQCDNSHGSRPAAGFRHHVHAVTAEQQQQRWSSSAASKSKPTIDNNNDEHAQEVLPTTQPPESNTTPAANHPPTLPVRQWSTPLAKTIAQAIEVTGPISIASYMRQCLTNPDGGYYTTTREEDADQFGTKGDFITSPEISQIFGELVGIWFMTEWMAQGRPLESVQFIEMGPGRGTLMSDILRTVSQFGTFAKSISAVWLVEAGEGLRLQQKDVLCGEAAEMKEVRDHTGKNVWWEATSKQGIPVRWVEDVVLLPDVSGTGDQKTVPFILAHEFFDALPIHAFESVAPKPEEVQKEEQNKLLNQTGQPVPKPSMASKLPQWRELLVAPTKPKLDLSSSQLNGAGAAAHKQPEPDFQLTLAKASTPTSLVIPERPRYRHLKNQVSSRVEVSPESSRYIQEFARRIGGGGGTADGRSSKEGTGQSSRDGNGGAALIIDYGPLETVPVDSLRAIRRHKIVSPFVYAGEADISADVDFVALAQSALEASPGVEVHGPVEQGFWLGQLGIKHRAEKLVEELAKKKDSQLSTDELERKKVEIGTGWKRLVEAGPKGMGKAYKVMTIVPENGGRRRPVGFGGNVVG